MKMTEYHPFKSYDTKEKYLKLYDMQAKKWPVSSESKIVNTSYGQTFVRISGPSDALPLVLLPGMGSNSLMWQPNIEKLSKEYRVYAVDNIYDYGRSVYTQEMKCADDFVEWLEELFDGLKLGNNISIMGLSYGGWLTSQYVLQFPERLNKIVLLAPAATVLPIRAEFIIRAICTLLPFQYFTKSFIYWILEDLAKKEKETVENESIMAFLASRCFKPKRLPDPTVLEDNELKRISVPALYLVGENEKIYSAEKATQRLNEVAPQIKIEIIPNACHDLNASQADIVNEKILEFLKT